jgi:adenosylcobinamide-phosphate guanylyltransferase
LIGIRLIETLGTGYSNDLSFVPRFSPEKVLLVPADLPLIDYVIVGKIMDSLQSHRASAISIILTKRFVEATGVRPSVILDFQGIQCCHAGITLYDSRQFQAGLSIPEEYVLMNQLEIAVNVNTKEELEIARRLLVERTKNLAKDHSS